MLRSLALVDRDSELREDDILEAVVAHEARELASKWFDPTRWELVEPAPPAAALDVAVASAVVQPPEASVAPSQP